MEAYLFRVRFGGSHLRLPLLFFPLFPGLYSFCIKLVQAGLAMDLESAGQVKVCRPLGDFLVKLVGYDQFLHVPGPKFSERQVLDCS
jgi:hypothetical protein